MTHINRHKFFCCSSIIFSSLFRLINLQINDSISNPQPIYALVQNQMQIEREKIISFIWAVEFTFYFCYLKSENLDFRDTFNLPDEKRKHWCLYMHISSNLWKECKPEMATPWDAEQTMARNTHIHMHTIKIYSSTYIKCKTSKKNYVLSNLIFN